MTEYAEQLGFGGKSKVEGNLQALVAYVFEKYPETRNDNKLLVFYYWLEHCNLADSLVEMTQCPYCGKMHLVNMLPPFKAWFATKARMPGTITRRQREIQRDIGAHKPTARVQEQRDRKARQGPLRR